MVLDRMDDTKTIYNTIMTVSSNVRKGLEMASSYLLEKTFFTCVLCDRGFSTNCDNSNGG